MYFAAYIVDLILVLCEIFRAVKANYPKGLSLDLVMNAQAIYKSRSSFIHAQIKEAITFDININLEEEIESVIWGEMEL